jgi:hypothetical protein
VDGYKAMQLAANGGKLGEDALKRFEQVADRFKAIKNAGKVLKTIGGAAGIIVDALTLFDDLEKHDWSGAAADAVQLGVDTAALVAPDSVIAGAAAPITGALITLQALHAAITSGAAIIRDCKIETVRQAGLSFVDALNTVWTGSGEDYVADCMILTDIGKQEMHDFAQKQAMAEGQRVYEGIRIVAQQLLPSDPPTVGNFPDVLMSLGGPTLEALNIPQAPKDSILGLVTQLTTIFQGANEMTKYVNATYNHDDKTASKADDPKGNGDGARSDAPSNATSAAPLQ